ncbi:hypothetical protein TWF281_006608 [Arthrobotrys megalospora]
MPRIRKLWVLNFVFTIFFVRVACRYGEATAFLLKGETPLRLFYDAGPLPEFKPPPRCFTGHISTFQEYSTTILQAPNPSVGTLRSIYSLQRNEDQVVGCFGGADAACCPRNWGYSQFYNSGSCPPGYSTMPGLAEVARRGYTSVIYLRSGIESALPCCPILTYSYPKGKTSGTATAVRMALQTYRGVAPKCFYETLGGPLVVESYTESGTAIQIRHSFSADPLYIFNHAASGPKADATALSVNESPSVAKPGEAPETETAASTATPENATRPNVSVPQVAGIGIGVAFLVLIVGLAFITWIRARRRRPIRKVRLSRGTEYVDDRGIIDNPGEAGGIDSGSMGAREIGGIQDPVILLGRRKG